MAHNGNVAGGGNGMPTSYMEREREREREREFVPGQPWAMFGPTSVKPLKIRVEILSRNLIEIPTKHWTLHDLAKPTGKHA